MDEILDEEISNLLKKHNIPPELMEILADDAIRMSLNDGSASNNGITFCSNDDGKLFAITRCIEKIRRVNSQYAKVLDKPGTIEYVGNNSERLKSRRPEHVIDLDHINMAEERKKVVFRYTNSFVDNKLEISSLDAQIDEISGCYTRLKLVNKRIDGFNRKLEEYKSRVAEIETSIIPNVFRHKKLKMYNQKVRSYMSRLDKTEKLRAEVEDVCDKTDELVIPRKKRMQLITSYNGIIGKRVGELLQKYGISQEEIKVHVSKSIGIDQLPEGLVLNPKVRNPRKGLEK